MRRAIALGTVGFALLVLGIAVFHDAAVAAVIRAVAGSLGYSVAFQRLQTGFTTAVATGTVVVNKAGEPVLDASRVELHYSLRDLLPGSSHRFGLTALDIQRPKIVLIHHPDGTYNIALPAGSKAPTKPDTTPIDVRARIRDGSVLLIDRFVQPGVERRQRIVGIAVDASLAPHTHSFYNARFDVDDGRTLHPVVGKATFEADRGFEAQRWSAAVLPIGPLIDFALPSHAIDLVDGELRGLDARIYTFVRPDGSDDTHVSVRAQLERGKIYVAALAKPLRDAHGPLRAYDDGLTTTGVDATLAGVPLHLQGGVYGLGSPQMRFGLTGSGELAALRQIAVAGSRQPVGGDLTFAFQAVGPVASPLVLGTFSAPVLTYGAYRFDRPSGAVAVNGTRFDILNAQLVYGPAGVTAAGSLRLEKAVATNVIATVDAAGDGLPYVAQVVRGLRLEAVAHVQGVGAKLATDGVAYGDGANGSLNALFGFDANGNGVAGPLSVDRTDGARLYARVAVDRRTNDASGIIDARAFSLLPARAVSLPGLDARRLPAVAGTLDAALAGSVDGGRLSAASGHVRVSGMRAGAVRGDATADIAGAADGTQAARLTARTNAGDLDANGTYDNGAVAVDGRLHSTFARVQTVTGDLGARGAIDVPLRAMVDGDTVAAQVDGARFEGADVRGIPLRDADATITVRDGTLDVRAARLGIAGGTVIAQGRAGNDTDLVAATSPLALRDLAGSAVPVSAGTALAHVHARGSLSAPRVALGLVVADAIVRGIPVAANATATYGGHALHIDDATALAAGGYATASGDVRNLGAGTPAVDVDAAVHGAQIAALDRVVTLPLRYPDGEVDADLHAGGPATAPRIDGQIRIPQGSVNGLAFRDARVALSGTPDALSVRGGTVTVSTTTATFDGDLSRAVQRVGLRAPRVDLADFDDYFNAADTLAGRGRLAVAAAVSPASVRTNGDVHLTGVRYRRYAIGTTDAQWSTHGRTVNAVATVSGPHGNAHLVADTTLPANAPLRDPLHRTNLRADASLDRFDLATWLPAAGITAPVAGVIAASARANGAPAAPAFALTGSVANGAVAGYHIDALTVAANGDRRRATVSALHLAAPGLTADANGSAGYRATDPVALALHADAPDLPVLERAAGVKLQVGGAATTEVHVSGTRNAPRIAQTLDITRLTYDAYTLPHIHGDAVADARTFRLNALEADLPKGRLLADATVPISLTAPQIGIRNAPLHATVRADAIDLTDFTKLLPGKNNRLTGVIDGTVVASGTPHDPSVDGSITLANGSYASDFVRSAFTNARARLAFTRERAQLTDVHADVGGGAIDGNGTAQFGDVRNLQRTLVLNAQLTAKNARIAIDPYLSRSTVNGTVTATKAAGAHDVLVGGTVAFSQTRIPLTGLIPKSQPTPAATTAPPPVAFDLTIQAGNDVRVQGGGVDIGARGAITVGGDLAGPTLSGQIASTDGRLSFYRTFVLQSGTVSFAPADGIIPNVDATATTRISNPDTDILLHVTGQATALNIDFSSNPSYDKEQILGLLLNAQAIGAVPGVQAAQNTGGSGFSATNVAGGYLAGELTQNLLEPLGSSIGSSLGFSDLALGYDYGGGFSAGATRQIGKHLTASVHQSFGADQRTILGFAYALPKNAAFQFSLFSAGQESPRLGALQSFLGNDPFTAPNYTLQALQPPPGVSGYVITYQRKYP